MSGFGRKLQQATIGAGLSLSPSNGTFSNGTSVVVTIYEDSQAVPINSVQANLSYDQTRLQYVSIDTSGGPFTGLQQTGGSGSVQIGAGSLSGSLTGNNIVATVRFTAIATGATTVVIAAGSVIYRSSDGQDILKSRGGATYTII